MSRIDPCEPSPTEGEVGPDEHVEVLVEDLFVEDYTSPVRIVPELASRPYPPVPTRRVVFERGLAKNVKRYARAMLAKARSLVSGLLSLGGLVLAALIFGSRLSKQPSSAPARGLREVRRLRTT